ARLALFAQRSAALRTDFRAVDSVESAGEVVCKLATAEGWSRLAHQDHPVVSAIAGRIPLERMIVNENYDRAALERCDAGITACDALIAQTGSVLLTSRSGGGRVLSVLPPHHVVVATGDQLLADLPEAYQLLQDRYAQDPPSFATLITGPSRTGDIERILVLGAHGPRKLTVVLIQPQP
ncbi:MAG: LUD domain-containing protein, partial [Phycisphaerae bacterium]|nr:LUD domain-containing protein [Phycisphaerae bacterium]